MKRITRTEPLPADEAARLNTVRDQVASELPDLIARHHQRTAPLTFLVVDHTNANPVCFAFDDYSTACDAAQASTDLKIVPLIDLRAVLAGEVKADDVVKQIKRAMYQTALDANDGSVVAAARQLGTSHQTFINQTKALGGMKRRPIHKHHKSIIDPEKRRAPGMKRARMSEVLDK